MHDLMRVKHTMTSSFLICFKFQVTVRVLCCKFSEGEERAIGIEVTGAPVGLNSL